MVKQFITIGGRGNRQPGQGIGSMAGVNVTAIRRGRFPIKSVVGWPECQSISRT